MTDYAPGVAPTISWLHGLTELSWSGPPRAPANGAPALPTAPGRPRPPSRRSFDGARPGLAEVAGLVRAAYGPTVPRPVPSAGGLYGFRFTALGLGDEPVEAPRDDLGLQAVAADPRAVAAAVLHQFTGSGWLLVLSCEPEPYEGRYGLRGYRYLLLEAGHIGQRLVEEAGARGLASCPAGAYDDRALTALTGASLAAALPVYALALGRVA